MAGFGYSSDSAFPKRQDLRELLFPLSILQLDPADRLVLRLAGEFLPAKYRY